MPKRLNGEGTIYQRKNGLWCADLTLGYKEDGKRIKKSLSSMDRETLLKKVNEERRKLNLGIPILSSASVTVSEWLEEWLYNYKELNLRPKTIDLYRTVLNVHIKPNIGSIKLNKLNSANIQSLYNLTAKQNKYGIAYKINVVLNQALNAAVKLNMIASNPNLACSVPKKQQEKVKAMTKEEQELFENACQTRDNIYRRAFLFLLQTGLRIGEMCALTWEDVDLERNIININKTAGTVRIYDNITGESKNKILINSPKTKTSIRIVPLSKKARGIIEKQKHLANDSMFIFPSKSGNTLENSNIRHEIERIVKETKIKTHLSPHVLRHTFATRMIEKGANVKALSDILGHAKVQMTLDIYTDVMQSLKDETINLLNE